MEDQHLAKENIFSLVDEERCLKKIIKSNYRKIIVLPEVQEFIKDSKNEALLTEAFEKGNIKTVSQLNLAFQRFQQIIRRQKAISYAIGIIKIYSKDYDKRVNKRNNRSLLILDKPVKNNDESSTATLLELIQDTSRNDLPESLFADNSFEFKYEELEKQYNCLTPFQKKLLKLKYIEGYSQREISHIVGQTEQNIYYWHKKTIKQLQNSLIC